MLQGRIGFGRGIAHHGELLQGNFQTEQASRCAALVTLPWPQRGSSARFTPGKMRGVQVLGRRDAHKAQRAATLALQHLGCPFPGGLLELMTDLPRGRGLGSSTSDVVAAIRAVADAAETTLSAAVLGRLAVSAEAASDGTMFEGPPVLFAHREGAVLDVFSQPLPPLGIVGVDLCRSGQGIDTLRCRTPRYNEHECARFEELRHELRVAIDRSDVAQLGAVATASARINQHYLPAAGFSEVEECAVESGAAGVQVAHSGTVVGLLFDARHPEFSSRCIAAARLLQRVFPRQPSYQFMTASNAASA